MHAVFNPSLTPQLVHLGDSRGCCRFPGAAVQAVPYNGIVSIDRPYLAGGVDDCDGLCVTYTFLNNETRIYGCAPRDVRIQLNLTDDNACFTATGLTACFCRKFVQFVGDSYPSRSGNLSCYSGFGYRGDFYVSLR